MRSEIVDRHSFLLNEAQDIINEEIKSQFKAGKITSPYRHSSWLDVVQVFDYTLPYWDDSTVLCNLDELLLLIKIYDMRDKVAKPALKLICSFILATETLYYWNDERRLHLLNRLQRYFPLKGKELNYDYLRYVYNSDIAGANENQEVIISQ